jgi:hypothetical protein
MSHIESGIAGVSEERVRRLAAHYGCTDEGLLSALVAMATERTRGWWDEYRDLLPQPFLDLAELEHHASYRWDVDFLHVPGLLQTQTYALALFSYVNPEFPKSDVERWVEHRMKRRVILERPDPIPYETVIHEAAQRGLNSPASWNSLKPITSPYASSPSTWTASPEQEAPWSTQVVRSPSWTPSCVTDPMALCSSTPKPNSPATERSSVG